MSCLYNSNKGLRAAVACGVSKLASKASYVAGAAKDLQERGLDLQERGLIMGSGVMGAVAGKVAGGMVVKNNSAMRNEMQAVGGMAGSLLGVKAGEQAFKALPKNGGGAVGGAIGGALGGPFGYLTGARLGNQIGARRSKTGQRGAPGPGGALYDDQTLNLRAGVQLSETFGGGTLTTSSLLSAVGDQQQAGRARPLVKQGGEDDLFTAEGPRGQIAFTLPDGPTGPAKIEGVIPAKGREAELAGALDGRLPKYVVTDEETGDLYATRNPYEAWQFSKALNLLPEDAVAELHPGETGFDVAYKDVPEALFY